MNCQRGKQEAAPFLKYLFFIPAVFYFLFCLGVHKQKDNGINKNNKSQLKNWKRNHLLCCAQRTVYTGQWRRRRRLSKCAAIIPMQLVCRKGGGGRKCTEVDSLAGRGSHRRCWKLYSRRPGLPTVPACLPARWGTAAFLVVSVQDQTRFLSDTYGISWLLRLTNHRHLCSLVISGYSNSLIDWCVNILSLELQTVQLLSD